MYTCLQVEQHPLDRGGHREPLYGASDRVACPLRVRELGEVIRETRSTVIAAMPPEKRETFERDNGNGEISTNCIRDTCHALQQSYLAHTTQQHQCN